MAEEPKPVKAGDPCPVCGGEFAAVPGAAVKDGEALYRCTRCGYYTRLPEEADKAETLETPNPHGQARAVPRRSEPSRATGA
jgi:hypothetical protein